MNNVHSEIIDVIGKFDNGSYSSSFLQWADEKLLAIFNKHAAQQSVRLTALRRGMALSIFINVILLVVVLFTIGGK